MSSHDHLIHVDEARNELVIYRIEQDGRKSLYTSVSFPKAGDKDVFAAFAKMLGENVLFDLPAARRLLGL